MINGGEGDNVWNFRAIIDGTRDIIVNNNYEHSQIKINGWC